MPALPQQRSITRRFVLGGSAAGAALVAGCGHWLGGKPSPVPPPAPAPAASAELKTILDNLATAWLKESPEFATGLGVSEAQAGGPFMSRLSDYSAAGMQRAAAVEKSTLAALDKIDRTALSEADSVSFDVVHEALAERLAGSRFAWGRSGFGEPTPYQVTQLGGSYIDVPSFLDAQHPIRNGGDVDAYLARLDAFAGVLDQETALIEADAGQGVAPPDFALDKTLKQLHGILAKKPHDSIVVVSLKNRIGQAGLDGPHADKAVSGAAAIVAQKVVPAMKRQSEALAKLRKGAAHDAGIWRLKDGDQFYSTALRAWTTTSMTPDEIHQMGLDLCKSINAEMDAILKSQGLTRGTLAARVQHVMKDPKQLYPNTDAGRTEILKDLNGLIANLQPILPHYFGTLAKAKLEIRRVPPFKEAGAAGGYYEQGSLDGSRPGYYYINLRDMHEMPKFTLPTLTYHEGEPGHHWQGSIAQENGDLPFVRSALLWFSGYGEGWALYAEKLCDEIGLYKDDPYGRLGYLKDAALRAGRLVVDTGMHAKRWSREKAIDFMVEVNCDVRSAIVTEIERYAVWPGQACSYMIGRETIHKLREDAKAKLGAKFDIRSFHDVVLKNGAVPLSTLAKIVNAWVAAQG